MKQCDSVWIYALLWAAVLFVMAWCLTGCDAPNTAEKVPATPYLKYVEIKVDRFSNVYYVEFKIDGCEYIHFYTGAGITMHKPTCKNHGGK